jgi:hypothetical protein
MLAAGDWRTGHEYFIPTIVTQLGYTGFMAQYMTILLFLVGLAEGPWQLHHTYICHCMRIICCCGRK